MSCCGIAFDAEWHAENATLRAKSLCFANDVRRTVLMLASPSHQKVRAVIERSNLEGRWTHLEDR